MNKKINVAIKTIPQMQYPIHIGNNLLHQPKYWLDTDLAANHLIIITDHHVKKLYGTKLYRRLKEHGIQCSLLDFPAGESSKNIETKIMLENKMLARACDRHTTILALGGGVVGDLAGFIAATYMRGVPYIQIPTTLLSMVDSSVGGKTGIDTPYGKNLIGAFYQPKAVVTDLNLLETLSEINIRSGYIEAIKMFMTSDVSSFNYAQKYIQAGINTKNLHSIIERAVTIKAQIVTQDELDKGQRAILNFGHTFGHALEALSNYKILHGIAVGYGILVEAKISELLGILPPKDYAKIKKLLFALGICGKDLLKYDIGPLLKLTKKDKKNKHASPHYILLQALGAVYCPQGKYTHPITNKIARQAIEQVRNE